MKYSEELRQFLFDEEYSFSSEKGEFIEQSSTLDGLITIKNTVYDLGKNLYEKWVGGSELKSEFSRNGQEEL